jgi:hypothetical protein
MSTYFLCAISLIDCGDRLSSVAALELSAVQPPNTWPRILQGGRLTVQAYFHQQSDVSQ